MFSLLLLLVVKLFRVEFEFEWYSHLTDEDIKRFCIFLACNNNECLIFGPVMFLLYHFEGCNIFGLVL
jgi:hypothetical protein